MFSKGFLVAAMGLAMILGASQASAQQFNQPFSFRVHNNVAAMNMAVILRNVQNEGSSSTTSSSGSSGSSSGTAIYNLYETTTIGNMNEITAILEQGAEGWISLGANVTQDGSGSTQSATTEGTQIFGGANTMDGDATQNGDTNNNGDTTINNNGDTVNSDNNGS